MNPKGAPAPRASGRQASDAQARLSLHFAGPPIFQAAPLALRTHPWASVWGLTAESAFRRGASKCVSAIPFHICVCRTGKHGRRDTALDGTPGPRWDLWRHLRLSCQPVWEEEWGSHGVRALLGAWGHLLGGHNTTVLPRPEDRKRPGLPPQDCLS